SQPTSHRGWPRQSARGPNGTTAGDRTAIQPAPPQRVGRGSRNVLELRRLRRPRIRDRRYRPNARVSAGFRGRDEWRCRSGDQTTTNSILAGPGRDGESRRVRAAVALVETRDPPHIWQMYVGRVPRGRRCHGLAYPAIAIPSDVPPAVPAVA